MVLLHGQFAGVASLRSSAPLPWPPSRNGRKFLPKCATLLHPSSRLPLRTLNTRSPNVHVRSSTRRLSVSASAAADPEYPKPSYEHSIFLHILEKLNRAGSKVGEVKPGVDKQDLLVSTTADGPAELPSLAEERDVEEPSKASFSNADWSFDASDPQIDQCSGGRQGLKTDEQDLVSTTADGPAELPSLEEEQDGEEPRNASFSSADWNFNAPDPQTEQCSGRRQSLNSLNADEQDLLKQKNQVSVSRKKAGRDDFEVGLVMAPIPSPEAVAGSNEKHWSTEAVPNDGHAILAEGSEEDLVAPSEENTEQYSGRRQGMKADEHDLLVSTAADGPSELPSLGEEQDVEEPSKVSFSSTDWDFDVLDPQTEQYSRGRQGLKVGRQVFMTGEKHYNRWMPNSGTDSHLQPSVDESTREEELLHPISQSGESGGSLAASDGDDEISGATREEALLHPISRSGESGGSLAASDGDDEISGSTREGALLHPISQSGESGGSLAASDGDDETSGGENIKEDEKIDAKQDEGVQLSLDSADKSGGEDRKDLLVEFLTKRSEHWGESTRPFLKDASVSLKAPTPKQTGATLSAEENFLFTSAEAMTAQDDLPESPSSSMGDGKYPVPKGLVEEVLSIAKSIPPNASLETFLTPFCGQISTNEGNVVLKVLGENHFVWPMRSFFQWMRVHEPCLLDSRSFCTLFTCLGKLRMADQALLQYQNMPDDKAFHCVQVYNSLIGALARAGRPEKIPIILQEMEKRNVERDPVTYSILITATKGGQERYDRVWSLFDDLLREGVKPSVSVYGSLIKAFCDEGHLKQALLVSLSMEKVGLSPNVIIYNTLIDAHARASQLEEAEGLLLEMKQRGFHPIESTYNALINGYGRSGQLDVAEELVLEMQNEGLRPNVATYTSLISAYGKHFSSEKAVNVFLRMKKSGLVPNTQTYTVLINAYAEGGWHEKAQSAFDNMLREGLKPTVETYTSLLDGYRRARDLDMVKSIWNTMKEDGCKLTRITYRTVMDAFSKHGFYVEARDVMDEFRKRGLEPDTMIFNMLLNAYARGGVCTKLRNVLWEMEGSGCEPDSFTYCTMIYSYIRHRDFTSAFKYDREMLDRGLMPSPEIYAKMRFILDAKYAEKMENEKKGKDGQDPEALQKNGVKNPQRKKTSFKRYQKKGPRRGSERAKALWKDKEKGAKALWKDKVKGATPRP